MAVFVVILRSEIEVTILAAGLGRQRAARFAREHL